MHLEPPPPYIPPPPRKSGIDPEMHWKASRLVGIVASLGLLIALWLPWLGVSEYQVVGQGGVILTGPGGKPISVTAMDVSPLLTFVIAAAALSALLIAIWGPLDEDGHWDASAVGAYWLAGLVALGASCAIAFGLVPLPSDIPGSCAAQTAVASDAGLKAACGGVATGELHSTMLFGAVISVLLSLILVGTAAWGTLRQPVGD